MNLLKYLIFFSFIFSRVASFSEDLTPEKVLKKYDEIMAPQAFETNFSLESFKEDNTSKKYIIHAIKKDDDKFRLSFESPISIRDQEILRNDKNFWLYLPNVKRVTRIANRDSFQGGDFNNADILKPNYSNDYNPSFAADSNENSYHLILTSKDKSTAYDKIDLWCQKKDFMPIKASFYATSGKILRSAVFSEYKIFSKNYKRPTVIIMKNEFVEGRKTELIINSINLDKNLENELFNINSLGNKF